MSVCAEFAFCSCRITPINSCKTRKLKRICYAFSLSPSFAPALLSVPPWLMTTVHSLESQQQFFLSPLSWPLCSLAQLQGAQFVRESPHRELLLWNFSCVCAFSLRDVACAGCPWLVKPNILLYDNQIQTLPPFFVMGCSKIYFSKCLCKIAESEDLF